MKNFFCEGNVCQGPVLWLLRGPWWDVVITSPNVGWKDNWTWDAKAMFEWWIHRNGCASKIIDCFSLLDACHSSYTQREILLTIDQIFKIAELSTVGMELEQISTKWIPPGSDKTSPVWASQHTVELKWLRDVIQGNTHVSFMDRHGTQAWSPDLNSSPVWWFGLDLSAEQALSFPFLERRVMKGEKTGQCENTNEKWDDVWETIPKRTKDSLDLC